MLEVIEDSLEEVYDGDEDGIYDDKSEAEFEDKSRMDVELPRGKRGRPRVSIEEASPSTLKRRYNPLDEKVSDGKICSFLRTFDLLYSERCAIT